jgi:hypothetical protein
MEFKHNGARYYGQASLGLARMAVWCKNYKGGYKPAWIGFARCNKELAKENMRLVQPFVVLNSELISSN